VVSRLPNGGRVMIFGTVPDQAKLDTSEATPTRCPRCGSADVLPIRYGYPGPEMVEDWHAGRIALGGCMIHPDYPDHACRGCGHEWRSSSSG
jgi:hypothetical protein